MNATITIWESDERWRDIGVEQAQQGIVRLGISFGHEAADVAEQALGADLTASECRQLASLLEAAAIGAEAIEPVGSLTTAEHRAWMTRKEPNS
tara:strand:- start:49 stop:330 length:282 start_codon:yes stop_codon:yes gene_type:complete